MISDDARRVFTDKLSFKKKKKLHYRAVSLKVEEMVWNNLMGEIKIKQAIMVGLG